MTEELNDFPSTDAGAMGFVEQPTTVSLNSFRTRVLHPCLFICRRLACTSLVQQQFEEGAG